MFNKLKLNKMKKFFYSMSAVLAIACAVACEETKPVQLGEVQLSASYDDPTGTYNGGYGWLDGDKIGLFVIDSGSNAQSNLEYAPATTTPEGYNALGEVDFNPAEKSAVLGAAGQYTFLAYYPYTSESDDYTAIPLPDVSVQEDGFTKDFSTSPTAPYVFAYTNKKLNCASNKVSLGVFNTVNVLMTIAGEATDDLANKKVSKLILSAETNIAAKNATINLATGEISGEMVKTIEYTFNTESDLSAVQPASTGGYFGPTPATFPQAYTLVVTMDIATAQNTDFTVKYVIEGTEYTMTPVKPTVGLLGNLSLNVSAAN